MKIYAVRHAQADHNVRWRLNDDPAQPSDLTSKGRLQAQAIAQVLAPVKFDAIYTSALPRTNQTAAIINGSRGVPVVVENRLNEVRTGFGGQPTWRWLLAQLLTGFKTSKRHKDGETLDEARIRIEQWLTELKQRPYQSVLIVAHQHTIQTLSSILSGISYAKALKRPIRHTQVMEYELV